MEVQLRQTFQETVKVEVDVETLMSAKRTFATLDHGALIQEEAMTDAMISMNVPMEHISLIEMLDARKPITVILLSEIEPNAHSLREIETH